MSSTGVPSIASRPATVRIRPSRRSRRTMVAPIRLGRFFPRWAKMPTFGPRRVVARVARGQSPPWQPALGERNRGSPHGRMRQDRQATLPGTRAAVRWWRLRRPNCHLRGLRRALCTSATGCKMIHFRTSSKASPAFQCGPRQSAGCGFKSAQYSGDGDVRRTRRRLGLPQPPAGRAILTCGKRACCQARSSAPTSLAGSTGLLM